VIPISDVIPPRKTTLVTIVLIAINAAAFAYERSLDESAQRLFFQQLGLVPATWSTPAIVTSLFLSRGWVHAIGNLIYLWIFGASLEDRFGRVRFAALYLASGAAAALAHVAMLPYSNLPVAAASGAIAGVIAAYFVLFPESRVLTAVWLVYFVDVVEVPAFFYLGLWFLLQFVSGHISLASIPTHVNVAFGPQLVGFIAGGVWGLVERLRAGQAGRRWADREPL
jgi:membrane associated rhomboid family serine protease